MKFHQQCFEELECIRVAILAEYARRTLHSLLPPHTLKIHAKIHKLDAKHDEIDRE